MNLLRRLVPRKPAPAVLPMAEPLDDAVQSMLDTELEMATALTYSLRTRDPAMQIVGHCARVAALAEFLAAELELPEDDARVLREAARLHEVGLVAIPPELLHSEQTLSDEQLQRVRSHARVGAEIVRPAYKSRVSALIENQYSDYAELQRKFDGNAADLLLAGLLRVADVFDAMTHPRAYQQRPSVAYRRDVLRGGQGTKFHPAAVALLLEAQPARS